MIILLASDKGGVGKTTTGINIASYAANRGDRVAVLKADKNPDMLNWHRKRQENGLPDVDVFEAYGNISKRITSLSSEYPILIVDCPGHDSEEFRSALLVSDVLLTLVKPSSDLEVETLTGVMEKAKTAQTVNKKLSSHVLLTRIDERKSRHKTRAVEIDRLLRSDPAYIQPLRTRLSELDVFESAANEGAGVHDVAKASSISKAKALIELLAAEIKL
ncbi:peptidyl-arginine deiminase [Salmonella enterica]|nr:peptidyl-arginine deiminase [Salmonella enterica]